MTSWRKAALNKLWVVEFPRGSDGSQETWFSQTFSRKTKWETLTLTRLLPNPVVVLKWSNKGKVKDQVFLVKGGSPAKRKKQRVLKIKWVNYEMKVFMSSWWMSRKRVCFFVFPSSWVTLISVSSILKDAASVKSYSQLPLRMETGCLHVKNDQTCAGQFGDLLN